MDFPCKNSGVGCHFLLQGSNLHLLCWGRFFTAEPPGKPINSSRWLNFQSVILGFTRQSYQICGLYDIILDFQKPCKNNQWLFCNENTIWNKNFNGEWEHNDGEDLFPFILKMGFAFLLLHASLCAKKGRGKALSYHLIFNFLFGMENSNPQIWDLTFFLKSYFPDLQKVSNCLLSFQ